jgi:DNA-directed RNA polymerase subunit RPC12/RpoP
MKCADCNEEILAANVKICPYCSSKKLTPIVTKEVNISKKIAEITKLEKTGRYGKAAREYETLGMHRKASNCKRLGTIEAAKLEKAGRYNKAAKAYEDLEMWEKAYKVLKLERRNLKE